MDYIFKLINSQTSIEQYLNQQDSFLHYSEFNFTDKELETLKSCKHELAVQKDKNSKKERWKNELKIEDEKDLDELLKDQLFSLGIMVLKIIKKDINKLKIYYPDRYEIYWDNLKYLIGFC